MQLTSRSFLSLYTYIYYTIVRLSNLSEYYAGSFNFPVILNETKWSESTGADKAVDYLQASALDSSSLRCNCSELMRHYGPPARHSRENGNPEFSRVRNVAHRKRFWIPAQGLELRGGGALLL